MRPVRIVPRETLQKQALASDPARSAWVSANAGSGKTHVLSRRVIRLLLQGSEPSRILCLTYTRAAAANMANRVFRDLSRWALLDDAALSAEIAALTGHAASASDRERARRLFASALETPGGLKIQTIHAFCEAVLHQFPLEANIAGHFEMLDGQMEAALLAEARRDLITGAAGGHDPALAEAFAEVLSRAGESGLQGLLGDIVRQRDGLRRFIDAVAVDDAPYAALFEEFGFAAGETEASVADAAWPLPGFDPAYFRAFTQAAIDVGAANIQKWMLPDLIPAFAEADPAERLRGLVRGMLNGKGEPYGDRTFTKALVARLPDVAARYNEAAQAVIAARDRLALFAMLAATRSALIVADWLIARYETLKRARGFLDFNDLIIRTATLLAREDAGAWVHYKLDKGIDHILIDEAQDTSPDQWNVVRRLADEFFSGSGARDGVHRTVFAVGDEKQSIYSFQGAEPQAFDLSGRAFRARVGGAGAIFEEVRLTQSFRSTGDVLSAVDAVFALPDARRGLTQDGLPIRHDWIREGEPGYVELWASLGPQAVQQPDDWTEAVDHASAPAVRLADTIAGTIAGWIGRGDLLEGKGRPVRPGDIMVLVRKRDSFVHALSRSLKERGIAVAGADRLLLTDHIAVQDLLAIGRFVLQPHDDLSLAALLRSPVFGLAEERLFEIAWDRGELPLFDALRSRAKDDPALAEIAATLEDWRDQAGYRPVFEFYGGILAGAPGREGARRRLVARLGPEADDILDEFLSFALSVERAGGDGLESFIATLDSAAPEIKREMDQTRDQVRIMTVHASKGLEAPVVFLVDPGSEAFSAQHQPRLLRFSPKKADWRGDFYLWQAGGDTVNSVSRELGLAIRARAEEEYRRLLYVGMTRAEDRLVVCGYHGVKGQKPGTWHMLVSEGLTASGKVEEQEEPEACLPVLRFRVTPPGAVEAREDASDAPAAAEPLPAALTEPLPPLPALPRPLSPSGASAYIDGDAAGASLLRSSVLEPAAASVFAAQRGSAIHRLLQILPGLAEGEREAAARRYLMLAGAGWPEAERERALASVFSVLSEPRFGPVFAPGSRAEAGIMGVLEIGGRERAVSGKIDRLAVTDHEILIVDYKTGPAPSGQTGLPEAYVMQLALYRALLTPLYPGRIVRAALLFTETPSMIELDGAAMDAALARLAAP